VVDVLATDPYIRGMYAAHEDEPVTDPDVREALREMRDEVLALHEECRQMHARIERARGAEGLEGDGQAGEESGEPMVTWGHEVPRPEAGFRLPLAEQVDKALAATAGNLTQTAVGGKAAPGREDRDLELTSLLACGCFPGWARAFALAGSDTAARMDRAKELLTERRGTLAAKSALLAALGPATAQGPGDAGEADA